MELLRRTGHRPYPLPSGPWVMTQTWERLLFAHWPVPAAEVKALLPPQLALDTIDGSAWIGVVPFWMSGIRARGLPAVPYLSAFPEINVRTYVVHDGKPGVYFFSLDVTNPVAVALARGLFHLPYYRAAMRVERQGAGWRYEAERVSPKAAPAAFRGSYEPVSGVFQAAPGTLEYWLTERYCLYTAHRSALYRGDIHHMPWPLQQAEADIELNAMSAAFDRRFAAAAPLLHYADSLRTLIWPLAKVTV